MIERENLEAGKVACVRKSDQPVKHAQHREDNRHESSDPASRLPSMPHDQPGVLVTRRSENERNGDNQRHVVEQIRGRYRKHELVVLMRGGESVTRGARSFRAG